MLVFMITKSRVKKTIGIREPCVANGSLGLGTNAGASDCGGGAIKEKPVTGVSGNDRKVRKDPIRLCLAPGTPRDEAVDGPAMAGSVICLLPSSC